MLAVEDDAVVALWVRRVFEADGVAVDVAPSAEAAIEKVASTSYDLAIVDLGLPGRNGIAVVAALRANGQRTAILILTGRGQDDDVAAGLDAGADDYLTKPVSATVLRARVRAAMRRSAADTPGTAGITAPESADDAVSVSDLTLSRATRRVRGPRGEAELTAKEYALLEFLMARPGQVVPRERLLQHAWGYAFDPGTNVVEVALSRLRQKLAGAGPSVRLRTLRGMGVMLEPSCGDAPADE